MTGSLEQSQLECLVRIVDDDPDIRNSLAFMLDCAGWKSTSYASANDFLTRDILSVPGCAILDVRMPGMTGIDLQHEMIRRKNLLPVIFLTGHGDIDMAVEAIQEGAVHFLQKPVNRDRLLPAIAKACARSLDASDRVVPDIEVARQRLMLLSGRELEILRLGATGLSSKAIGERLGISGRTVETHRYAAYKKLRVHAAEEALKILQKAEGFS